MLHLEETVPQNERLVRTRVSAATKAGGDTVDTNPVVSLVCNKVTTLLDALLDLRRLGQMHGSLIP